LPFGPENAHVVLGRVFVDHGALGNVVARNRLVRVRAAGYEHR
jgi:hypothetical protein